MARSELSGLAATAAAARCAAGMYALPQLQAALASAPHPVQIMRWMLIWMTVAVFISVPMTAREEWPVSCPLFP